MQQWHRTYEIAGTYHNTPKLLVREWNLILTVRPRCATESTIYGDDAIPAVADRKSEVALSMLSSDAIFATGSSSSWLHIYANRGMHLCMRTTLDIQNQLLAKARRRAVEEKTTLTGVIEEALRHYLMPRPRPGPALAPRWIVVSGSREPAVDVADRDQLYEAMEGRGL